MSAGKELSVIESTRIALNSDALEKEFTELAKASASILEITNQASYQELHAAKMRLTRGRTATEKSGKAERDKFNAIVKQISAEEKRLIAIIEPEEKRLAAIQDEHDTRVAREKQAKIDAEAARLEGVRANIARLGDLPGGLVGKCSQDIADALAVLRSEDVGDWCQEFRPEANAGKARAISAIELMLAGTLAQEKAAAELTAKQEAERIELARLRAEADERDRRAAVEEKQRLQDESDRQAKIALAEKESRERIEAGERAARQIREEADRVAEVARAEKLAEIRAEQQAEQDRVRKIRAAEDQARLEKDAADMANRAQEDAERKLAAEQAQEKDRALQAEWHRQEAEKRDIERARQELLATDGLIGALRRRIGDDPRYAGIATAIDAYMSPGRPIPKPAKRAAA